MARRIFPTQQTLDFALTGANRIIDAPTPTGQITRYSQIFIDALGDFNGDGTDDIAVTTTFATFEEPSETLFIIGGPNVFNSERSGRFERQDAAFRVVHESTDSNSIRPTASIATQGDFNVDGIVDAVFLSDPNGSQGAGTLTPTFHVVFGQTSLNGAVRLGNFNGSDGVELLLPAGATGSGEIVTGDFNGDGIDDIAISGMEEKSDPAFPGFSREVGATYVVFGVDDAAAAGPAQTFGRTGTRDLTNGAPDEILKLTVDQVLPLGEETQKRIDTPIARADINGDGFDDLILAGRDQTYYDYDDFYAPGSDYPGYYIDDDPRLFVVLGSSDLSQQSGGELAIDGPGNRVVTISDTQNPKRPNGGLDFEPNVTDGVDFDGDGVEDIAVLTGDGFTIVYGNDSAPAGAPGSFSNDDYSSAYYLDGARPNRIDFGQVQLAYEYNPFTNTQTPTFDGITDSTILGRLLGRGTFSTGDVDGDGKDDLLVNRGLNSAVLPPADRLFLLPSGSFISRLQDNSIYDGTEFKLPTGFPSLPFLPGTPPNSLQESGFATSAPIVGNLDGDDRVDFSFNGFIPNRLPTNFNFGDFRSFLVEPVQTVSGSPPTLADFSVTVTENEAFGLDLRPDLGNSFVPPALNVAPEPLTIDPDGDALAFRLLAPTRLTDGGTVIEGTFTDPDGTPLIVSRLFRMPAEFDRLAEGKAKAKHSPSVWSTNPARRTKPP